MSGLLVTGAAGFVGGAVVRAARAAGADVIGTVRRTPAAANVSTRVVDLRDAEAVRRLLEDVRPTCVIATACDQQEWESTAVAPGHLARAARQVGADLVHVSSDVVFAGGAASFDERAAPCPTSTYGAAKAAAEVVVRSQHPDAAIVRISVQVGGADSAAERFVQEVALGRRDGVMFTDDIKCVAEVGDTATGLLELAGRAGVFHLPGGEAISRLDLARLLCTRRGWPTHRLRPGTRAAAGLPGPAEIRLDGRTTVASLRTRMRGAHEFLSPDV